MKRKILVVLLLLMTLVLTGCNGFGTVNNEIHNKSIDAKISITEYQDVIVEAIKSVSPAVLGVSVYEKDSLGIEKGIGVGSGVVYSCSAEMKDGNIENDCTKTKNSDDVKIYHYLLVTNRHVVTSENNKKVTVKIYDGELDKYFAAKLIQVDDKVDLAVISFSSPIYITPVKFADSDTLERGQFLIAIGNPAGFEFHGSATLGIVSYPKRYMSDDTDGDGISDWDAEYIQHDCAINPGNSGGALINIKGELVGINTLKLVDEKIDNMGFSIPSNVVKEIIKVLEKGEKPKRFTLNITGMEVKNILRSPEPIKDENGKVIIVPAEITNGIYVSGVNSSGIGATFLEPGDYIVGVGGNDIYYMHQFRAFLNQIIAGEYAKFKIYRNGEYIELDIEFK